MKLRSKAALLAGSLTLAWGALVPNSLASGPPISGGGVIPAAPSGTVSALGNISAGGSHTCAIKTSGTVQCWGHNASGESSPKPGTYVDISAGWVHTCGITTSDAIACWGDNHSGQASPPFGAFYTAVSAGFNNSCAILSTGHLVCWGDNYTNEFDAAQRNLQVCKRRLLPRLRNPNDRHDRLLGRLRLGGCALSHAGRSSHHDRRGACWHILRRQRRGRRK